jgi:quercetin dioxygenase-like cupin family protein
MKIIHYQEMEPKPVTTEGAENVNIRWLIAKEDGAPHFAMRLFEIQAGGHTPLHKHRQEHEVFILEGDAAVIKNGEEVLIKPGTAVFIPPEEEHGFVNKGKSVMRMLCMVTV